MADTNEEGIAGTGLIPVAAVPAPGGTNLMQVLQKKSAEAARRWIQHYGIKVRRLPDGKDYVLLSDVQYALLHGEPPKPARKRVALADR
jgi:hypothetical protein